MLNQKIGQYQIISKLGEGGMAEVYLAEKGTLGKKVACVFDWCCFVDEV